MILLNKLNICGIIGVFSYFKGILFLLRLHIEFDKNANSSYVSVLHTFRISLLSDKSGFVFFVRNFGCALFDIEVFMKVLIWIACFFTTALIQTLFGMKLGGIPAAMFFGATFSIAKNFVARYDSRNNKTSKKYAETSKGLMKGFLWYGAAIFYVILGTIFVSTDPASFDFGTQIIIAILCIGVAIAGHILIDKKVQLKYSEEIEAEVVETNDKICFCRKCGTHLEADSRFCSKCGTEIKE